jgi:tRNA pseudouridine55 synthase
MQYGWYPPGSSRPPFFPPGKSSVTLSGFLVINKDAGLSSHAVVGRVRRLTGQKKAGHTGTLDPFATGVLPLALGEATRYIQFLDESHKEYRAVMRLGESTDTQDFTGTVIMQRDWHSITETLLHVVASSFTGPILQIPPMFSAIKRDGVPLYQIARKGGEVTRDPRSIHIYSLIIEKIEFPDITFQVSCSRGTYVRTLAHDMGEALGCGAHLVSLTRTRSGPFALELAITIEQLAVIVDNGELADFIALPQKHLSHIEAIELDDTSAKRLLNGLAPGPCNVLNGDWPDPGKRVLLQRDGVLLAVAEGATAESVRLLRVFA